LFRAESEFGAALFAKPARYLIVIK
jgi:hypothetical protein